MKRRNIILGGAGLAAIGAAGAFQMGRPRSAMAEEESFEITLSEAEWRERLSDAAFDVLRKEGTERAFTSPLNDEKRAGDFTCAGCALPVFSSETKFDSGTGWPSFWAPIEGNVRTKEDRSLFMVRTECHCRRCGGHLGHVFEDGPEPTGERWCINGVALNFVPASA